MLNEQITSTDDALLAMTEYDWITYLPSNRICQALVEAFSSNKYMKQIFGNSIVPYRRDDFPSRELPGMSIYEIVDSGKSRYYPLVGQLVFDVYYPIMNVRQDTERVFNTLGQTIILIMQQQQFFYLLGQYLVPTPPTSSQIYQDVVNYKTKYGSSLVNFGQNYEITQPVKAGFGTNEKIGDVWKQQIKTSYEADLSNYYAMLEEFGINFGYDPNQIIYPRWEDFAVTVTLESSLPTTNE